jgi:hypothetical protein
MSIDVSLVLNIALGIIVAKLLIKMLKDALQILNTVLERIVPRRPPAPTMKAEEEDWLDLWSSLSESVKEQSQRLIEDDQLRRRAQDLNLWPYL